MEINVNGKKIFQLEDWEKKVIHNDIPSETFEVDCCRRLEWVLKHKAEQCYARFESEWIEKLRKDPNVNSIPTDKKQFVEMVCARPDYKDRSVRDIESEI